MGVVLPVLEWSCLPARRRDDPPRHQACSDWDRPRHSHRNYDGACQAGALRPRQSGLFEVAERVGARKKR